MTTGPHVGIDLGTTNTLVAVLRETGPEALLGPDGSPLIPSAVALDEQGRLLVGAPAVALLARDPSRGARWFKRDMGTSRTWSFGGQTFTPVLLSSLVLREARQIAERALGVPVTSAVVTVPAYFGEPQRAATLQAADLAGLRVERIVNEPTAAAIAHGVADAERERRVAVVDLGGGTLDVTLLDIFDGIIEVVGTGGDGRLGGEDFTDLLWRDACVRAGLPEPGERPSRVMSLLREECEQLKRALASADFARLRLPARDGDLWVDGKQELWTRPAFAVLCRPLLDRLASCVRDTLVAARRTARDVDEVVLVGGATRMAAVQKYLHAIFDREPVAGPDPDLAIALGAALQSGLLNRHQAVGEVVVTDVLAHSLGVSIVKRGEDRVLEGYFLPVLHRNTTLPTRRVERVYTTHPKQAEVRVRVFEGEHRYVSENQQIGEFTVKDLPPAEDPVDGNRAIDLAFTHDLNGLLEVEASLPGTDKKASLLIEKQAGRLTPEQRAKAVADLERLRVLPRDLLPNRLLLEEALTRHARLSPDAKKLLDAPLTAFEDALGRQHPEAIAAAALHLRNALAHPLLRPEPE